MNPRGTIYHHKEMIFHNGFTGKKYLVLLNTPSNNEPYIFVKTTSQQKNKPTSSGCIKKRSLFFIPGGKTFFPKNTWVQLYEIYTIRPIISESLKRTRKRAHKEVAHLTYARLKVTPETKPWHFVSIAHEIQTVFEVFLKNVPGDNLHPIWQSNPLP